MKRRDTPKPKANVHEIERDINGYEEDVDQVADDMGFVMVGYEDLPAAHRQGKIMF